MVMPSFSIHFNQWLRKRSNKRKKGKKHTKAVEFSQTMLITLMFFIISNIAEKDRRLS